MPVKLLRNLALSAFVLTLFSLPLAAQKKGKGGDEKPSDDPTTKARNVKPELKDAYKKWLNTDVAYIITKDEKKTFLLLQTDEERENFIENFWRRRDPDPDTEENETDYMGYLMCLFEDEDERKSIIVLNIWDGGGMM